MRPTWSIFLHAYLAQSLQTFICGWKKLWYTHTLEFEDSMKMLAKILDGRNIKLTRVEKIIDVTDTNNVDAVLRRYTNQGTCVWMKIYIR